MKVKRTENEPHSRLTRLCAAMTAAMEADPEYRDTDKAIIFLDDGETGGIVLHGYESDSEAMADLIGHLMALFKANGKQLIFAPLTDQMEHAMGGEG